MLCSVLVSFAVLLLTAVGITSPAAPACAAHAPIHAGRPAELCQPRDRVADAPSPPGDPLLSADDAAQCDGDEAVDCAPNAPRLHLGVGSCFDADAARFVRCDLRPPGHTRRHQLRARHQRTTREAAQLLAAAPPDSALSASLDPPPWHDQPLALPALLLPPPPPDLCGAAPDPAPPPGSPGFRARLERPPRRA